MFEGGTVVTHAVEDETCAGRLIYDGMSTVLSSSARITSYATHTDDEGRQVYSFQVPCDRRGVAITWAMDDEYAKALAASQMVLADYRGYLGAKTRAMNDLLNYQIPYFRCSDPDIVAAYYYLWALYLMYYIDVGQGWEMYPHTQTAVNNFLGTHRYDANFQIKVGAWTADKDEYAYGNVLHWRPLLPYARRGGALPDTNYYAILGMYHCHVGRHANQIAQAHLKRYNMHWGIPIAPEAWSKQLAPWGDQFSNFNAGKILLILEGMAGLEYSIPQNMLTVRDSMPEDWSSMEVRIPIKIDGRMQWPRVSYQRKELDGIVRKMISVSGNPLTHLKIQPWLEEGAVQSAPVGYLTENQGRNRIGYRFETKPDVSVTIEIKKGKESPTSSARNTP